VLHKLGFPTVCTAKAVKYRNAHLMQLKLVSDYLYVITKQCVDVEGKKQKRKRKKKTNKIEQEQKQNVKYHVMKEKNTRIIGIITVFNPDQFFLILTMQNIITVFLTIMFCLENLHGIFEYVGYIYLVYFMRKLICTNKDVS
jgi:hypothetical protein